MLKSFRGLLGCLCSVSSGHLGSIFRPEVLHRILFGRRSSGIFVTWPVHLSCASFKIVCKLCNPALFRTCIRDLVLPPDLGLFSQAAYVANG